MIGKQEWFGRRKYSGWGLTPATWQGWVYLIIAIIPFVLVNYLNISGSIKLSVMIVWAVILGIDFIDLFMHLKKDEREVMHEAIAERNAMWFMIIALCAGVAYQVSSGIVKGSNAVDPVIIVALVGALVVKIISNIYLERKQ